MKKVMLTILVLFGAAFIIGLTVQMSSRSFDKNDQSLLSPIDADRPLDWTAKSEAHFPLHRFSAWERLLAPTAREFTWPMGSATAGLCYNAQGFAIMNERRGGPHLGDDWNGIGGRNTDLGDPIYAAADGRVAYVGEPSSGWGNVVILHHRLVDGSGVQTMYAHLHEISVSIGALVGRGQIIGTCGNAHGTYDAHLHYEVRIGDGVDIGKGYGALLNRKEPAHIHDSYAIAADLPKRSTLAIQQAALFHIDATQHLEIRGNVQNFLDLVQPLQEESR